jgi:cell division protease FtsH
LGADIVGIQMRPLRLARLRQLPRTIAAVARRRPRTSLGFIVVAAAILVGLGGLATLPGGGTAVTPASTTPTFTYAREWSLLELQRHIEAGEIIAVTTPAAVNPGQTETPAHLVAKTADGQVVRVDLTIDAGAAADALASLGYGELLTAEAWAAVRDVPTTSAPSDPLRSIFAWVVPSLFLILLAVFLFRVASRGGAAARDKGSNFVTILPPPAATGDPAAQTADAADAAPPQGTGVRLSDVAGCDEAKLELTETIEFLRTPERFRRLGARIPRGIMLYGPPGTGKTMLAKAVASEAGVAFVAASGSEFVEKFVGVGARRIRDLFEGARRHGRAVVFIDEFDAIGKARGGANSHEEREQTLNQLLVEMDGFTSGEDVVIIAATNRLDILDPAVVRPGRFTRKIHVGLPDVAGRREILAVHARGKPIDADADLETVARKTYGFSGAQLADLMNEAAILAARRSAVSIASVDLHGGWLKVAVGTSRRRSMDERERSIIAAHEVGHAICGRIHGDKRKVEEISLFAHGEALGVTVSSQEDNDLPAESDLRARLIALMGGRAAEELVFHEVTGGAANDFEKANQLATAMVTKWGMGRDPETTDGGTSGRGSLGFLVSRPNGNLPSEVQAAATRAIRAILDEAYAEACRTLVEHMATLRRLAAYLVEHERLDGETFDALFEGHLDVPNALSEWRPEASRPRAWDDIAGYHDGRHRRPLPVAVAAVVAATPPAPAPAPAVERPAPPRKAPVGRERAGTGPRLLRPWLGAASRPRKLDLPRRARRVAAAYLAVAESLLRPATEADPEG